MKERLALIVVNLFVSLAGAQVPTPDDAKEPRDRGSTAAMHVYWYAPKSLEITHVKTYLIKDEDAFPATIGQALLIALPHASDGDRVSAQCVGMHPPEAEQKPSEGSTQL